MGLFGRDTDDASRPIVSFGDRRGSIGREHGPLGKLRVKRAMLEPSELRSRGGRIAMLIAAVFICLFWNGIVSIFVTMAVRSHLNGRPDWIMTLFMIPFVLVGLGFVAWVVHAFFSLFNPEAILSVSGTAIAPGEELTISWQFSRRPSRIREFSITLRSDEHATYTVGTDSRTDTERLHEIEVFRARNPAAFERGSVEVRIPEHVMHSFEAPNNKITWKLRAHGEIGLWPDVNDEHDLVVAPRAILDRAMP